MGLDLRRSEIEEEFEKEIISNHLNHLIDVCKEAFYTALLKYEEIEKISKFIVKNLMRGITGGSPQQITEDKAKQMVKDLLEQITNEKLDEIVDGDEDIDLNEDIDEDIDDILDEDNYINALINRFKNSFEKFNEIRNIVDGDEDENSFKKIFEKFNESHKKERRRVKIIAGKSTKYFLEEIRMLKENQD